MIYPMSTIATNSDSEINGVTEAVRWVKHTITKRNVRILLFCDNMYVVNAVKGLYTAQNRTHHFQIDLIRKLILQCSSPPEIWWIKAHNGVKGNELADKAAKKARKLAEHRFPELKFKM